MLGLKLTKKHYRLLKRRRKTIESSILVSKTKSEALTGRCVRTAYYVAYHNQPYTDYEQLIQLQEKNSLDLGCILYGRTTCTEMAYSPGLER